MITILLKIKRFFNIIIHFDAYYLRKMLFVLFDKKVTIINVINILTEITPPLLSKIEPLIYSRW
jgi:hypothetical protein